MLEIQKQRVSQIFTPLINKLKQQRNTSDCDKAQKHRIIGAFRALPLTTTGIKH